MAITLVTIDPNNPISDGPTEINSNFTAVKSHIDDLEALLAPATNTLKLTNTTTIPNNSIESATITLSATSGNAFVVAPGGGSSTFSVTFDGIATGFKFVATGTGSGNASLFQFATFAGDVTFSGAAAFAGVVDFTAAGTVIKNKVTTFTITDANCGSGATNKVDVSKEQLVLLDYNNSGGALAGNADVNLDLTSLVEGSVIEIHCLRKNSSGNQKLYNGTSGNEIFAYIDPNGSGITTISNTSLPTFDVQPSPDNKCYIRCRFTNIGGGTFRLLVIDSKGMLNVN